MVLQDVLRTNPGEKSAIRGRANNRLDLYGRYFVMGSGRGVVSRE